MHRCFVPSLHCQLQGCPSRASMHNKWPYIILFQLFLTGITAVCSWFTEIMQFTSFVFQLQVYTQILRLILSVSHQLSLFYQHQPVRSQVDSQGDLLKEAAQLSPAVPSSVKEVGSQGILPEKETPINPAVSSPSGEFANFVTIKDNLLSSWYLGPSNIILRLWPFVQIPWDYSILPSWTWRQRS